MKTIVPFAASVLVLGLAACTPPADKYGHWGKQAQPLKVASKLDCPENRGQLHRVSAAPDGRSCTYNDDEGSTVELKLVDLAGGDYKTALAPIEANLRTLVPMNKNSDAEEGSTGAATAEASAKGASAEVSTSTEPTNVSMHPAGAKLPNGRSSDNVSINLPGIHINANDDGAKVRVAGMHIDADDRHSNVHVEGDHAQIGLGGKFSIDADHGGAVIRSEQNDANIRTNFILASDESGPEGEKAAGYVARGPRSGPLVVAVVQVTKDHDHHHHDSVFDDATRLVKDNTHE